LECGAAAPLSECRSRHQRRGLEFDRAANDSSASLKRAEPDLPLHVGRE
jgi:hypothetical protein